MIRTLLNMVEWWPEMERRCSAETLSGWAIKIDTGLRRIESMTKRKHTTQTYDVVYALQTYLSGAIKIGTTQVIEGRLKTIQSMNGDLVTLIGCWFGNEVQEKAVHRRISAFHSHGEWYAPSPEVLKLVELSDISEPTEDENIRQLKLADGTVAYIRTVDIDPTRWADILSLHSRCVFCKKSAQMRGPTRMWAISGAAICEHCVCKFHKQILKEGNIKSCNPEEIEGFWKLAYRAIRSLW